MLWQYRSIIEMYEGDCLNKGPRQFIFLDALAKGMTVAEEQSGGIVSYPKYSLGVGGRPACACHKDDPLL